MAAHLVASGNNLHRTTNIVSGVSDFTAMAWYCQTAGALTGNSIFVTANGTPGVNTYTKYAAIQNNTGTWTAEVKDGTTTDDITYVIQSPLLNVWKHLCYTRASGVHSFYVNGSPVPSSQTLSLAAAGLTFILLGDDGGSIGETILLSNYREWNVALTVAQVNAELASTGAVVHSAGIVAFTPLTSNGNDISGNGNNWTATGTVTYVADPVFPANFCPNDATVISTLPGSNTDSLQVTAGQAASGFFSYAPVASDTNVSVFPFGVLGAFAPLAAAYTPSGAAMTWSLQGNTPIFFSVEPGTVGHQYLIEAIPNGTLTTPTVILQTSAFLSQVAPVGSPAIPSTGTFSDGYPAPLALLEATGPTVLSLVNGFPAAGLANILSTGTLLVTVGSTGLLVYSKSYTLIASLVSPGNIVGLGSDGVTTFYVLYGSGGHYKVQAVSATGVLGSTVFDLGTTPVKGIGANAANTILDYYVSTPVIAQWNLVTNASLGTLVASPASLRGSDFLVLQDDSIVYGDNSGTIVRYSSAGTLVNTITTANSQTFGLSDRLATGTTAGDFWHYQSSVANSQFVVDYLASGTGATHQNVAWPTFLGGAATFSPTATPALFGPDPTCPLWVTRAATGPMPVPPPTTGVTDPIRRLRRFSLPFENNVMLFLRRLEFLVQSGVGLISGPGSFPIMMVRISGDGGLTWSQELAISFGKMGEYTHRAILHQLGSASNFVVEVTVTDPVFAAFLDCFADMQEGAW